MAIGAIDDYGIEFQRIRDDLNLTEVEFSKRIIGNVSTLGFMMKTLLCNGHVLLEGLPGLGKTLMVKTMAEILDLNYQRIQFTPDLMPADIIGTNMLIENEQGGRFFKFEKGPIFTNILLADEINRASPKTQSALLQAMEEGEATVFGKNHPLDSIFFTLATQNPIEMAGTYPLPEAQLDRFLFKLHISAPNRDTLKEIARLNVAHPPESLPVKSVLTKKRIMEIRILLQALPFTDRIYDFASELIRSTHPDSQYATEQVRRFVSYGASPRGLNALLMASRISAIMAGRVNVSLDDLEANYLPSLRHRIILRFEGEVEEINTDTILQNSFQAVHKKHKKG